MTINMEKIEKNAFCVMGKEGSTDDGAGFIQVLWKEANAHFSEISAFAKRDEAGNLVGMWGAMTNFDFTFQPWEDNFSKGRYLAGVECQEEAIAPVGWKKWIIPGFTYIKVLANAPDTFPKTIAYLENENIALAGAVQDFTDPKTGENYMFFPIAVNDSKREMIRRIKNSTNQVAACGFHCEHCFMGEWCGGCRSACNMCSFATLSEDNQCENQRCSQEKGLKGCWECETLLTCTKGFYQMDNGWSPKADALFIQKYGEQSYTDLMKKAKINNPEFAEELDQAGNIEKALEILEQYK